MKLQDIFYFYRVLGWQNKMSGVTALGYTMLGYLMAGKLVFLPLFFNAVAILLGVMFAFSINNYFDWKIQGEKNFLGTKIEKGGITQTKTLYFCFLPLIIGFLVMGFSFAKKLINPLPFLIFLILFLLSLFYATPPIRLKERKTIGFLTVPLGSLLIFLQGYFVFGKLTSNLVLFTALIFLFLAYLEIVHILEDSLVKEEIKKMSFEKALKLLKIFPSISLFTSLTFAFSKPLFLITSFFSLLRLFSLRKFKIENIWQIRRNVFSPQLSLYEFFVYGILGVFHLI